MAVRAEMTARRGSPRSELPVALVPSLARSLPGLADLAWHGGLITRWRLAPFWALDLVSGITQDTGLRKPNIDILACACSLGALAVRVRGPWIGIVARCPWLGKLNLDISSRFGTARHGTARVHMCTSGSRIVFQHFSAATLEERGKRDSDQTRAGLFPQRLNLHCVQSAVSRVRYRVETWRRAENTGPLVHVLCQERAESERLPLSIAGIVVTMYVCSLAAYHTTLNTSPITSAST